MLTIAYIANQFPSLVEPYVADEIQELRRRGMSVVPSSVNGAGLGLDRSLRPLAQETLYLRPLRPALLLRAGLLCVRRFRSLADLVLRVLLCGHESPSRRLRALLHTWIGAYYAILLNGRAVQHIHCHHGYSASWIAMVASRLLGVGFSITLHGSDLLLHAAYLDAKLRTASSVSRFRNLTAGTFSEASRRSPERRSLFSVSGPAQATASM